MTAAAKLGGDVTPQVLLEATTAILALVASDPNLDECLDSLARKVTDTDCFDAVVCALRAYPQLLNASTKNAAMNAVIVIAATRSRDAALALAVGRPIRNQREQTLSGREREVLQLAAEGFRNDEIGRRLFISPKTVKTHLQNIYEKLNVKSRTEAALKAKETGLLREG